MLMVLGRLAAILGLALANCSMLFAQGANDSKLAFVVPNLFGPNGLRLDNPSHDAHFDSSFQANFGPFNSALATQLTSLPIPSPASGFTYSFDSALGVYNRSAQGFGPILTERAETIGKDRFYFGFSFQHFSFQDIDDVDLGSFPVVFTHSPTVNPESVFLRDVISTQNLVDVQIGQFTTFFTYGLTDQLDVSVAVPFVTATVDAVSVATIRRLGTGLLPQDDPDRLAHTFRFGQDVAEQRYFNAGSASGLGDITIRLKGTTTKWEKAALALAADLRLPTGDEFDFLGTGAPGFKPFVILSYAHSRFSPHVNVGYQFNGNSLLAGNLQAGEKGDLADQFLYSAGVDIGVTEKFTLAADFLGQRVIDAPRVGRTPAVSAAGVPTTFDTLVFADGSFNTSDAAFGFKVSPAGTLLVTFNLIVKLNSGGLRGRVAPLVGLSYTP
jgi:hypothetical protein